MDEQGNRAVGYVLYEIIGRELTYDSGHIIECPKVLDLENQPELMTKLLCCIVEQEAAEYSLQMGIFLFQSVCIAGLVEDG